MKMLFIDLFCGAGGVTTGIHMAKIDGQRAAKVFACVNHDPIAIESHAANHTDALHFAEDIRTLDLSEIVNLVRGYRKLFPNTPICLWASLECTNFSKAKGGLPREADSRTLANHLFRYLDFIDPDYIFIENVEEFMSWGPLDGFGKPVSRKNGQDYLRWVDKVRTYGYNFDWRILNSADYGAYTSRKRYFAIFAKPGFPIKWPEPTHSRKPVKGGLFGEFKKWRAVKEVLDFQDEGKSIFNRKKDLSDKTLGRIYAGLIKYVAGGEKAFLSKYYSGEPSSMNISVNEPSGTLTTKDHHSLIQPSFISKYYGNGDNNTSVEEPAGTITTVDRMAIVNSHFIDKQYSGDLNHQSIDQPAGSIVTNDKHSLITSKRYIVNPQYNSKGISVEEPCFTLIARMDKMPPSIVSIVDGRVCIDISDFDSSYMRKIKEFMVLYGIIDIKMRMLKVNELLKIQGFPGNYFLAGNQSHQKKSIGNSVPPKLVKALIESHCQELKKSKVKQEAA